MIDLKRNDRIQIRNGSKAEVIEKLGEGGQGSVYKVRYEKQTYALKIYHQKAIKRKEDFYNNL